MEVAGVWDRMLVIMFDRFVNETYRVSSLACFVSKLLKLFGKQFGYRKAPEYSILD